MVPFRRAVGRDTRAHVQAVIRVGGEQDGAAFHRRFSTEHHGLRPFLRHPDAEERGHTMIKATMNGQPTKSKSKRRLLADKNVGDCLGNTPHEWEQDDEGGLECRRCHEMFFGEDTKAGNKPSAEFIQDGDNLMVSLDTISDSINKARHLQAMWIRFKKNNIGPTGDYLPHLEVEWAPAGYVCYDDSECIVSFRQA